jgi:subtilisin family serine protease
MTEYSECHVDVSVRRIADLLRKRDDVAVHPETATTEEYENVYLYRPGELLVGEAEAEQVEAILRHLRVRICHRTPPTLGTVRYVLNTRSDVETLIRRIRRASGGRRLRVSPNHVLLGCPGWRYGPADEPDPDAAPDPPEGDDQVWDGPLLAIVDTGLAADFGQMELLDEGVEPGQAGEFENPDEDHDGLLDLEAGHGTFIAGVVRQRAPGVPIVGELALDADGVIDEASLASELDELLQREPAPDIVNLSLGGYTRDDLPLVSLRFLEERENRPLIVAAAGNDGTSAPFYPAALPWVVAVGAIEETDGGPARASFTNFGPWVDACAPGVDIVSTFQTGNYRSLVDGTIRVFNGGARWSGTSFAAPYVAAVVAAYVHDNGGTAQDAWQAVRAMSQPGPPGLGVLVN